MKDNKMKYLREEACGKCDMNKFLECVQYKTMKKRLRCQVTKSYINKSKNADDVLKCCQQ